MVWNGATPSATLGNVSRSGECVRFAGGSFEHELRPADGELESRRHAGREIIFDLLEERRVVAVENRSARRRGGESRTGGSRMSFGPYIVDTGLQEVRRADTSVELTQREYDLVCYFLTSSGRVVSREELMEKVWGYEYYGDLRAVDVAMRRLREKLEEDPANPKYFITKRGAGYYLQK